MAGFALSVAARNVVALYRPLLEPMGLTHPQYLVMLALWERSPSDLATVLSLDPGTLSPLLKRLEAAGLGSRQQVQGDERTLAVNPHRPGTGPARRGRADPAAVVERLGMPLADLERLHACTPSSAP